MPGETGLAAVYGTSIRDGLDEVKKFEDQVIHGVSGLKAQDTECVAGEENICDSDVAWVAIISDPTPHIIGCFGTHQSGMNLLHAEYLRVINENSKKGKHNSVEKYDNEGKFDPLSVSFDANHGFVDLATNTRYSLVPSKLVQLTDTNYNAFAISVIAKEGFVANVLTFDHRDTCDQTMQQIFEYLKERKELASYTKSDNDKITSVTLKNGSKYQLSTAMHNVGYKICTLELPKSI